MIYIDPPYNTGNDFIYDDNFSQSDQNYRETTDEYDDEGNRLVANPTSNGRFHTDWLNMIYPRLKLARDLLTDDGVIFISIDDNEQANLKKICDEIFGEGNFVANFIWQKNFAPKNDNKYISTSTENILLYSRNKFLYQRGLLPRTEKHNSSYSNPDGDTRGDWTSGSMLATTFSESGVFEIFSPEGKCHKPPRGRCWRFSKEKVEELKKDNRVWFGIDGNGVPRIKRFLSEMPSGIVPQNLLLYQDVGSNQDGTQELKKIFNSQLFNFPKGTQLIRHLCIIGALNNNDIILDFFSGSATTAHAVMKLNAEDGGKRKFIMVQLPEVCDEDSEAYKAGYENICEIGKERIRRAGQKIKEESPTTTADLDIGFRVLKIDSSNMEDVFYTPDKYDQKSIDQIVDNIKPNRSGEDLLFQVLLDMGVSLSSRIERKKINKAEVFYVYAEDEKFLIACFDKKISDEIVTEIAKEKPTYFVMRDVGDDCVKINFEQIFKAYSPDTTRVCL